MKKVNPVIDKDLENKAFRVFLRLIDRRPTNYEDIAQCFDRTYAIHCIPEPIGLHSMPSDEILEEYHPDTVYDSQI